MLNYNFDFGNRQVIYEKIIAFNTLTLGALAWRGYQLKSRGVILVYGLKESENLCEEDIDVEIGYLSKEEFFRNYRKLRGLFELMDKYNPQKEILVAFIDNKNSLIASYRLALLLSPLECYTLLQERMLKDVSAAPVVVLPETNGSLSRLEARPDSQDTFN